MHKLPIDYQLSDVEIMDGQGVILPLRGESAKGERVSIGQLTVHQWFFVFTPALRQFNRWLDNSFEFATLMGQMSAEAIEENAGRVHKMLVSNQRAAFFMADLLRKVGVSRWKPHKFLQMVTMEQLVEIFVLVYLFNTDGLKKKSLSILSLLKEKNTESQNSLSNSTAPGGYSKLKIVSNISPIASTPTSKAS